MSTKDSAITKARSNATKRLKLAHAEEYTRYLQSEYDRAGIDMVAHRPLGAGKDKIAKEAAAAKREARRLQKINDLRQQLAALESSDK